MSYSGANPEENAKHSPHLIDVVGTRWLPQIPPRLMAFIEGWGYDSLPNLTGRVFVVTGTLIGLVYCRACVR